MASAASLRRREVALVYARATARAAALFRAEQPDVWQQLVNAEYSAAGLVRRREGRPPAGKNPLTGGVTCYGSVMKNTHRPTTATYISFAETCRRAGLSPSTQAAAPQWLVDRYDAAIRIDRADGSNEWLVANYASDEINLQLLTFRAGVIIEQLRFPAPDGEVSRRCAATFASVVALWIAS